MKRNAFVMMPFDKKFMERYQEIYKPAFEEMGFNVSRADDFYSPNVVIDDIKRSISNADILLADITGKNPNVFYELGLAHALNKKVILISEKTKALNPFDIRHIRTIFINKDVINWGTKVKDQIQLALAEVKRRKTRIQP